MLTSVALLAAPLTAAAASTPVPTAGPVGPYAGALAHFGPWGPGYGGGPGWLFLLIPLFWIGLIALIVSLAARRRRRFWAANGGQPGPWGGPGWGGPGWGAPGWAGAAWGGPGAGWQGAAGFGGPTSEAEKTLAERFARGDIDEAEYRARLEVLQAGRPTPPAAPARPTKA